MDRLLDGDFCRSGGDARAGILYILCDVGLTRLLILDGMKDVSKRHLDEQIGWYHQILRKQSRTRPVLKSETRSQGDEDEEWLVMFCTVGLPVTSS